VSLVQAKSAGGGFKTVKFVSGYLSIAAAKLSAPLTVALSETVASLSLLDGQYSSVKCDVVICTQELCRNN